MDKGTRRAIILGAGASCSYKDSPTKLRSPLAREIMPTYYKLDISENRYVLVGHIINYVRDTRGIDPIDFGSWDEDPEAFLTEVDETIQSLAAKLPHNKLDRSDRYKFNLAIGAYNQLIFLFASIFNEIQNGPVSIPYALLASELGSQDTVITFNWDTLMDRALMSTNRWSPNNGYLIKPESIFEDGWKKPEDFECLTGGPTYIKLHGSTNWLTPYHGTSMMDGKLHVLSRYAMDKLFVFLKATRRYETYEDRYWGPYEPFSYCYYPPNLPVTRDDIQKDHMAMRVVSAFDLPEHGKIVDNDKNVYSIPLIVPPVRNKQYARYGQIFANLWRYAEMAISRCQELYVIGYSFPQTDWASKNMFANVLKRNRILDRVVIMNPHPESIEQLFVNEFKIEASKIIVRAERFDVPISDTSTFL